MKRLIYFFALLFIYSGSTLAQDNLALNKTVTASASSGGNTPGKLNDGNLTSRWESPHGQNDQWVQIDLGNAYDLTSSSVMWEGAAASSYDFMVSADNETWTKAAENTNTSAPRTDEFTFTNNAKAVRYVRLDLKTRTTGYGFSIYEWQVYGTPATVERVAKSIEIKPQNAVLLTDLPENLLILSMNNSLIDYNDQPAIFNQMALTAGKTAEWTKQTRLGMSLRYHYEEGDGMVGENPSAKMQVRSKPWTHIILQEQSSKPLEDPADFLESVRLWKQYVIDYCPNPDAQIILALNWPYTDAADFGGDMERLYSTYKNVAAELGVLISPIGKAYENIRQQEGETAKNALYTDNRHPSLMASYLAACHVYAVLFNESPVGCYAPSGLNGADALRMQTYAWNTCGAHTDVVDNIRGKINYQCNMLDQFNCPMSTVETMEWNVNGGGAISNGVFSRGDEEGEYTVSVQNGSLNATANILIRKAELRAEDTYFAEITNAGSYRQDFDTIGTSATAKLPQGWKIEKRTDAPRTLGAYTSSIMATEQTGGNNIASNATNGLYNFGDTESTDRAIGGISTSIANGTRGVNIYLKIKNTDNIPIHSFDIEYDIEKYRMGSNAAGFAFQMYYSTDGESWLSAGNDFNTFFAADASTGGYATVPGDVKSVSAWLPCTVEAGKFLYLAWNYSVAAGTEAQAAQALGLDNVLIVPSDSILADFAPVSSVTTFSENFDGIGTDAVAALPQGWKIEKRLDAPRKVGSFSSAVTQTEQAGGNNIATTAKNGIYNFGADNDRAVGGISTGIPDGTRCVNIFLKLKNTGDDNIRKLNIAYDVEKYRKGTNAAGFVFQMYYSPDGETWTSAGDNFNTFFAADASSGGYASAPDAVVNVSSALDYQLNTGETVYLAWNYSVASGTDAQAAQALGLDNVVITADALITGEKVKETDVKIFCFNKKIYVENNNIDQLIVYNINGIQVQHINCTGVYDMASLPSGVYIVKVMDKKGNSYTCKIVI